MARRKTRGYSRRSRSTGRSRRSYSSAGKVRRTARRSRSFSRRSSGQTVRLIIQSTPTGDSMVGVPGTVGVAQAGPPRKAMF